MGNVSPDAISATEALLPIPNQSERLERLQKIQVSYEIWPHTDETYSLAPYFPYFTFPSKSSMCNCS